MFNSKLEFCNKYYHDWYQKSWMHFELSIIIFCSALQCITGSRVVYNFHSLFFMPATFYLRHPQRAPAFEQIPHSAARKFENAFALGSWLSASRSLIGQQNAERAGNTYTERVCACVCEPARGEVSFCFWRTSEVCGSFGPLDRCWIGPMKTPMMNGQVDLVNGHNN